MRHIKLLATLRDLVGTREIELPLADGATVQDLIDLLHDHHPELAEQILDENNEFTGLVHIFVAGRNVEWLQGLETVIRETDQLTLVPPIAGG